LKTSVLIPTRWRKEGFKRIVDTAIDLAHDELEILVGADIDDDTEYEVPEGAKVIRYDNLGSSQKTCQLAKLATGDMMRLFSTDERVISKDWDINLYKHFPEDKLAVLFTRDDPGKHTGGCVPVVSKEWYAIAGYYPMHFWHFYADKWVTDIAKSFGRLIFADDIVIEHFKRKVNKSADPLYARRGRQQDAVWQATANERHQIAMKIKAAIG
jgi:hypothetical protein